ncbi:MAG TPA: EAL domain-containing protein [Acidimicrobiales bacterium]|nr:EAL domain-containing protein [Acidimicrobiales bacterium]
MAGRRHITSLLTRRRRAITRILQAADELEMVFQPIVDLTRLECVGYEALARFPDGRPPDVWFAEARALGVESVLEMAAIQSAVRAFDGTCPLSLNISPATAMTREFAFFVETCPPVVNLVIELTEHTAVSDYDALAEALAPLRERGVRVAVDDAGSGVASMRHVLAIAPDIIKLDCSLVAQIDTDDRRRALAASLIVFAERLGAEMVAEGIERHEEWEVCQDIGIPFGQGFYFGRPSALPAA